MNKDTIGEINAGNKGSAAGKDIAPAIPPWARNGLFPPLLCPVCGGALRMGSATLTCINMHSYDVARQGYVNLLPGKGGFYQATLFENRRAVFADGFFTDVAACIDRLANKFIRRATPVLLDAGCGEGYYTGAVLPGADCAKMGLDLSRAAIKMAASRYPQALFVVADLTRIPLPGHCVDCILDILTPAGYGEFIRVLRRGGVVIKAAPGSDYLRQLRDAAGDGLRGKEPKSSAVADHFGEKMRLLHRERVHYTRPVTQVQARHFSRMTPMLRRLDIAAIDLSDVAEITIDMEILVGARGRECL